VPERPAGVAQPLDRIGLALLRRQDFLREGRVSVGAQVVREGFEAVVIPIDRGGCHAHVPGDRPERDRAGTALDQLKPGDLLDFRLGRLTKPFPPVHLHVTVRPLDN
jgi:hypothetical protein